MYGAIIGDLASNTYQLDKSYFYKHLVSTEAQLSCYGSSFVKLLHVYTEYKILPIQVYQNLKSHDSTPYGIDMMNAIAIGWYGVSYTDCKNAVSRFFSSYKDDIQSVLSAICQIIFSLRQGNTKRDTEKIIAPLLTIAPNSYPSNFLIYYLVNSWKSFRDAFDFGSAIHNAMHIGGDKNLLGTLTGAMADAMYGCAYYIIKRKYVVDKTYPDDVAQAIELPPSLHYLYDHTRIAYVPYKFYVKNEARTNVDKHLWISLSQFKHLYSQMVVTEKQYYRILKSSVTSWECRHGLYLDDGWLYIYRSFLVLGRFQLKQDHDIWRFVNLQSSDERPYSFCIWAFYNALIESCDYYSPILDEIVKYK